MVNTNYNNNNEEKFLVTYQFLNGSNNGSLLANKEFHVCYCIVLVDLAKTHMKKIIGCFINPNDLYLEKDKTDLDKHIYYFQMYKKLNFLITIDDILKETVRSKNYSKHITKKILYESKDPNVIKMISKCESTIKDKVLIQ